MLDALTADLSDDALARAVTAHRARVASSRASPTEAQRRRAWVASTEEALARSPGDHLRFDAKGRAQLQFGDRTLDAGSFGIPTLSELTARARSRAPVERAAAGGTPRLYALVGEAVETDIGALQAFAPPRTLFQAASQFNCLEAPTPRIVPVRQYLSDPTQGPRAALSALPGTLVRHYAAPRTDGSRFVQRQDGEQLQLLDAVTGPRLATVDNGYLALEAVVDTEAFVSTLEGRFDALRVGLQEGVEVVLGAAWTGEVSPDVRIDQVYTSTVAMGQYGLTPAAGSPLFRIPLLLLRAAYLGTLLAARATGAERVVLTLIGGGVFGNPPALIWESILWALDETARRAPGALEVVVNCRAPGSTLPRARLATDSALRGGLLLALDDEVSVHRGG